METALRMEQIYQVGFWAAVVKIIWINILLSGDNAIVIALACRRLPRPQRRWGMIIGAGVASILLVVFTAVVTTLMTLPYLKLVGGCALLWIAFRLLVGDAEDHHVEARAARDLERLKLIHSYVDDLGVNLAGVEIIINLTERLADMEAEIKRLQEALAARGASSTDDSREGTKANGI